MVERTGKSITANTIKKAIDKESVFDISGFQNKFLSLLLSKDGILRNAYTMTKSDKSYLMCSIKENRFDSDIIGLHVYEQRAKAFAIFECKRVGVEEGMTKGPQTIEKAKNKGRTLRELFLHSKKFVLRKVTYSEIIYKSDGSQIIKPYIELMEDVVYSNDPELLRRFILTVGVVSNHGNWIKRNKSGLLDFSDDNFQKELLVLAQSYDWLLFLTDQGLSEFINDLLLEPETEYESVRNAF